MTQRNLPLGVSPKAHFIIQFNSFQWHNENTISAFWLIPSPSHTVYHMWMFPNMILLNQVSFLILYLSGNTGATSNWTVKLIAWASTCWVRAKSVNPKLLQDVRHVITLATTLLCSSQGLLAECGTGNWGKLTNSWFAGQTWLCLAAA